VHVANKLHSKLEWLDESARSGKCVTVEIALSGLEFCASRKFH